MKINNLVETHSHILPSIDDGAKDLDTSMRMVYQLYKQGARKIIATPHYYSDQLPLADFIAKREKALAELNEEMPDMVKIIPAAEVFITEYLFNNNDLSALSFGKENYILIEHPFSCEFNEKHFDRLQSLICDYNLTPILAHIERYPTLMNNEDILDELIRIGCLTQVNIKAVAELPLFQKRKLIKYIKNGKVHLLGSDCHNLESRAPEYEAGAKAIIRKCGEDKFRELIDNANNLF